MTWNGPAFVERIRQRVRDGVTKAADSLSQELTATVSTPGPPRSAPGESPHIDRDVLHAEMTFTEATDDANPSALAGSDAPYATYLERGTMKMAARPWANKTLQEQREQVKTDILS